MGQGGGAIGRGGPGGPASRSSPGRAESAERGAGRGVALSDRPWLSRSVRFVFCAVDASSGAGADLARERGMAEPIGGRRLSAGLGLHSTAAGAPGHRATGRGGPGLAGEHLSGDCPQGQGAARRNPLGRRDRPVQSSQLRPQLCPQRAHPGHPATGQALFAVDDFQPDQSGQAAFHDL